MKQRDSGNHNVIPYDASYSIKLGRQEFVISVLTTFYFLFIFNNRVGNRFLELPHVWFAKKHLVYLLQTGCQKMQKTSSAETSHNNVNYWNP